MVLYLSGFLICSVIIFFAGKQLSHYGDLIAELSGLGKAWIGLILMAAVTSLPELMVGISSARIVESADLAVGDILGSCAFNLGILSLMDVFTPNRRPLFSMAASGHALAASFGVILIAMVGVNMFLDWDLVFTSFLGLSSTLLLVVYLISVRTIFIQSQSIVKVAEEETNTHLTLRQVVVRYAGFAFVIILAALALPYFAEHISEATGLGKSFVGTLFLAASTSLPEIAVSYAAIRKGSTDLAIGNLLGSNLFNVMILFLDDLAYTKGHLLKDASDINLLTVFFVIMMTGVAVIGLVFPSRQKKLLMSLDTLAIFCLYLVNMILLYFLSA